MADFGACGSSAFPSRCLGARDQAAIGGEILPPREAVDLRAFVQQHEAQDRADAGHGLQQIQGMGVLVFGRFEDGEFDIAQQLSVIGDERTSHFEALVHRWSGEALGDPVSVGLVGNVLADGREVILAGGLLDLGHECAAFAGQRPTSTQQGAGRTPLGWIDIGLWLRKYVENRSGWRGAELIPIPTWRRSIRCGSPRAIAVWVQGKCSWKR
jgi:hypothetical protein